MSVTLYTRLDKYLVDRGYAGNQSKARTLIESGNVLINGQVVTMANFPMHDKFRLDILGQKHAWLSPMAPRLQSALQAFGVNPGGRVCVDVGAGVGGFADVLLGRNASHVYCLDSDTDLLAASLRSDMRITSLDNQDAATLRLDHFAPVFDLIVCDADASLIHALPRLMDIAPAKADLIALVKPEIELGVQEPVTDPAAQKEACRKIEDWLKNEMRWTVKGWLPQQDASQEGLRDFFVHAVK